MMLKGFTPEQEKLLWKIARKNTHFDSKGRACISQKESWDWYDDEEVSEVNAFRLRTGVAVNS